MGEVKVSFHNAMGTDTCAHNDRSMYDYAYRDRDRNQHWDCYGLGDAGDPAPSVNAEMRYYEDRFGEVLAETNRKYLQQSHPERVKSMEEYRLAHMPRESIIQLGASQDHMTSAWVELAVPRFVEKLRAYGCEVISWDIHVDESEETSTGKPNGTPHAHVRWIGVDSKGKPNLAGCLAEHGVNIAQERWTAEEAERHNQRARRKVRAGDLKGPQVNNRLTTLTTECRGMLEELADEYLSGKHGPVRESGIAGAVNRERVAGAEHVSVPEYKRRKRAQEREAQADAYVDEALRRAAAAEAQRAEAQRVMAEAGRVTGEVALAKAAAEEAQAKADAAWEAASAKASEADAKAKRARDAVKSSQQKVKDARAEAARARRAAGTAFENEYARRLDKLRQREKTATDARTSAWKLNAEAGKDRKKAESELTLAESEREKAQSTLDDAREVLVSARASVVTGADAVERYVEHLCAARPDLRDWLTARADEMRHDDVSRVSGLERDVTQLERAVERQTKDAERRASVPTRATSPTPPASTVAPPVASPKPPVAPPARRMPRPGTMGRTPSGPGTPQRGL